MPNNRATETEISEAVLKILASRHSGEATIGYLKNNIPNFIQLTADDRQQSLTRPNEQVWEQIIRNIVSHKASSGNYIAAGYLVAPSKGRLRITQSGRSKVAG